VTLARIAAAACCAALLSAIARDASAAADDPVVAAQNDVAYVSRSLGGVQAAIEQAKSERQTPERRLANGELLFGLKDYTRAELVLSEVIEEFPNTPSYPDALWLRGDTYYATHDYLAARRDFRALVEGGGGGGVISGVGAGFWRPRGWGVWGGRPTQKPPPPIG